MVAKLNSIFLSFVTWLFEGRKEDIGKERYIIQNVLVIRVLLWVCYVMPFVSVGWIFWLMANVPYFTLTVGIFWAITVILGIIWKAEVHEDSRRERTEIDHRGQLI